MREIKFRGISAVTNSFVYGNLVYVEEAYYIVPYVLEYDLENEREEPRYIPIIPETVSQYTDLKDKNGAEIYEGDICRGTRGGSTYLFVVKWDEIDARFLGYTTTGYICYVGQEPRVEVNGNIYENPELLEGGGKE